MTGASTKRVLFVDDDQDLLEALSRALQRRPCPFSAQFVQGGELAISALAHAPFDVVVTDWQMPNMNGGELLDYVRLHYPQIVRVVLSSQPELAACPRWASVVHRCLKKPCDARSLEDVLARACALQIR
jgi:DNA-binding NtrC family response regulator